MYSIIKTLSLSNFSFSFNILQYVRGQRSPILSVRSNLVIIQIPKIAVAILFACLVELCMKVAMEDFFSASIYKRAIGLVT